MPLIRRVPKRGFTNIFRVEYSVVNVRDLDKFEGSVSPADLLSRGLVRKGRPVKILGNGDVTKALKVQANKFSASARKKIEDAGGSCEEITS